MSNGSPVRRSTLDTRHSAFAWPLRLALILSWCLPALSAWAAEAPPNVQQSAVTELNNRGVTEAKAGRFEAGIALLRQALTLDPQDALVHTNLSGLLTEWGIQLARHGDADRAEALLREAIQHRSDNGIALIELGDLCYFSRSQFDQAIELWKRANGHVSAEVWQDVARRISQAQRDRLVERSFTGVATAHFDIRVQHPDHPVVGVLGEILETEYAGLSEKLGAASSNITVIIYAAEDLSRLYNQRDWFIGFYDGRMRLRWNEVLGGNVRGLVAHELAHAFLHRLGGPYLPSWVQEGFAQWNEGPRAITEEERRIEEGVTARTMWIPLTWIDRRFIQPSGLEDVERAYVESRLVVEGLIRRYGLEHFRMFVADLSKGTPVDAAFDTAFAPTRWMRASQGTFD